MDDISLGAQLTIVVTLILLSAFFSSSETAMMSLNRYRLKHLRKKGHHAARRASRLLKRTDRLISLILIGNNLVNFLAASIFTGIVIRLWGEAAAVFLGPVILTAVFLIFAEITPKTIAAYYPERIAFPASGILLALQKILFPFVWSINHVCRLLLRLFGINPDNSTEDTLHPDELRTIVGEAGPHLPPQHQGMLLNILDLEQSTVEDIMIPRNEVFGIDIEQSDEQILQQLRDSELTRIPIYSEDINNIIGILHQRKVSRIINPDGELMREQLNQELMPPYFIPESTPLNTQLLNFQKEKRRMSIVVDEYGVMQGLVTLEDILEEIVGEFTSNLGHQEDDIHPLGDNSFKVLGSATIRDINKALDWDLPCDGPKTINGLVLEILESLPDAPLCLQIENYRIEMLELGEKQIQCVRILQLDSAD